MVLNKSLQNSIIYLENTTDKMKEKQLMKVLLPCFLVLCMLGCKENKQKKTQSFIEHSPVQHHEVALEVLDASKNWIDYFNKKEIEKCIDLYTSEATLKPSLQEKKIGRNEISLFWKDLIKNGAKNLIYKNVSIKVANDSTAFISAQWAMNIANGIINQEKWVKRNNTWKLVYDDFEIIDFHKESIQNKENPTASHLYLKQAINASKNWIIKFNSKDATFCTSQYTDLATINAIPFIEANDNTKIFSFWKNLINKGANNLIYHQPIFQNYNNMVYVSSAWSMNIGEGYIYKEKWVYKNEIWKLDYDEFEVLKNY